MNIYNVKTIIDYEELLNKIEFIDYVYISIGGKINQRYITRNCHSDSKYLRQLTNSTQHLIPNFLKYRENKKILIISLDQYSNEENFRLNYNIIKQELDNSMTFIFFDTFCDEKFLNDFLTHTISFLKKKSILCDNFMICNYVKFMNEPNLIESKSENEIPKIIYGILQVENNIIYSNCFYEWYGYNYYTYNLIYKYKFYNNFHHFHEIRKLFQEYIKTSFSFKDDYEIISITKTSNFWDDSIDITSYIHNTKSMTLSLTQQYNQLYEYTNFCSELSI
jgi:hypothetical protein